MIDYKIGSISKLLGIPTETLRYYESLGILEPKKNADTGYRSYTPWEVNTLTLCRTYRGFGFPLTDVREMLSADTCDELYERFVRRENELIETIQHYRAILALLAARRSALGNAERDAGRLRVADSPEGLFLRHRHCYELDLSETVAGLAHKWMNAMPAVELAFQVLQYPWEESGDTSDAPINADEYDETVWGFFISLDDAHRFDLKLEQPAVYLPSRKCLHTVLIAGDKGSLLSDFAEKVLVPIREQGAQPDGDAFGQIIAYAQKDGKLARYCDVWVPIR